MLSMDKYSSDHLRSNLQGKRPMQGPLPLLSLHEVATGRRHSLALFLEGHERCAWTTSNSQKWENMDVSVTVNIRLKWDRLRHTIFPFHCQLLCFFIFMYKNLLHYTSFSQIKSILLLITVLSQPFTDGTLLFVYF